ncbi:Protease HtpX [Candidatus Erwinia haradaeae]|uniref:Protease HtpX n=1 Tax=Candidatus Erwinia haradaeae TaxID=1922217 RepID=A0A451DCK9_9GAMM|nr:protease HtpX [Candidatus Erwinia haradaeae]VFP84129.1 Protease HtpX [Candidatus Erwinia haradaeae]
MMRIALFLLTNLGVMVVFGVILSLTGIQSSSVVGLMIMAGLFGFGGAFVSLWMSKWMALRSVSGDIITKASNATEHWLMETITQQSKKVGISTPQIAIYHALDMNAFATGARRNSSLVAVSTGLLQNMTREEAEAVLAHEISHIANGDMVTMTLIQGIVNTFVIFISRILAQVVSGMLSNDHEEEEEEHTNGHPMVYFMVSMLLELIFGMIASMITMWFSRHREFDADAGAAHLVGREKMIAALERLKTSCAPEEAGSMMALCINGKSTWISEIFMSHPPLDKRINALRHTPNTYT